jgi:hypothetical protein
MHAITISLLIEGAESYVVVFILGMLDTAREPAMSEVEGDEGGIESRNRRVEVSWAVLGRL